MFVSTLVSFPSSVERAARLLSPAHVAERLAWSVVVVEPVAQCCPRPRHYSHNLSCTCVYMRMLSGTGGGSSASSHVSLGNAMCFGARSVPGVEQ